MKLYLVRGNDSGGENQDLFVVAEDPDGAIAIWNDYTVQEGWSRSEDDEEFELPRQRTIDPANVRQILPDVTGTPYAGTARAVAWDELDIVMEA